MHLQQVFSRLSNHIYLWNSQMFPTNCGMCWKRYDVRCVTEKNQFCTYSIKYSCTIWRFYFRNCGLVCRAVRQHIPRSHLTVITPQEQKCSVNCSVELTFAHVGTFLFGKSRERFKIHEQKAASLKKLIPKKNRLLK